MKTIQLPYYRRWWEKDLQYYQPCRLQDLSSRVGSHEPILTRVELDAKDWISNGAIPNDVEFYLLEQEYGHRVWAKYRELHPDGDIEESYLDECISLDPEDENYGRIRA